MMLKSSLTASLARQDMARVRSPRQYTVACSPTNAASYAEALLAQRPPQLVLVPANEAPIVRKAQPSADALPTAGSWAADPQSGSLTGLLSLLASEPEPDKLPANLMLEVAEQIGADGAYLFRTDAATQTLALAPWVIVDGAIRHRDTVPALLPLARASAMVSPPRHRWHAILCATTATPTWALPASHGFASRATGLG